MRDFAGSKFHKQDQNNTRARVLKLKPAVNLLQHLQQMERDSTFVELLMKLQQNTESHELLCMLNYLSHWKL